MWLAIISFEDEAEHWWKTTERVLIVVEDPTLRCRFSEKYFPPFMRIRGKWNF